MAVKVLVVIFIWVVGVIDVKVAAVVDDLEVAVVDVEVVVEDVEVVVVDEEIVVDDVEVDDVKVVVCDMVVVEVWYTIDVVVDESTPSIT